MARTKSRQALVKEIEAAQAKLKAHDKAEAERLGTLAMKCGNTTEVSGESIARLIELVGSVRCVVLNACFSDSISKLIASHVEAVIGCDDTIDDEAAIMFTRAFYRALSHGVTFEQAYNLARNELDLHGKKGESEKYKLLFSPPSN
jgi:hypothetical protein